MIRFENGWLEFDETLTQSDIDAIAQYASQAQRIQIEHIINLLENERPCRLKGTHHDIGFCSCFAISLIKGETNGET